jgi:hypothetical protein
MEITLDSAFYTLIGALGGILITQVANYFLESKKSKNSINLKRLELESQRHHDLLKERRSAYSNYLEAIDKTLSQNPKDLSKTIGALYAALIVANKDTTEKINAVFSFIKKDDIEKDSFIKAKKELLNAMQIELQS